MNQFTLTQSQKTNARALMIVIAAITVIAVVLIGGNIMVTEFGGKFVGVAFLMCLCGVSAFSGGRLLKKHSGRYGLGMATLVTSGAAFLILTLLILSAPDVGQGLTKFGLCLGIASAALGYICGITGIRETASSVYYLKIGAVCCVSVIGLYFIIQILRGMSGSLNPAYFLQGALLSGDKSGRILSLLFMLAISLTCMAKVTSMLNYEGEDEPPLAGTE
jgi:hypothetical protein